MALINIRSLRANFLLLLAYLKSSSLRLIALSETWISPDDTDIFSLFLDIGYTLFISSRTHGRGGGVGVIIHNDLPTPTFSYFSPILCRSHDSCNCLINRTKSDLLTYQFIITFTVILPLLPSLSKKLIHYRKIKSINIPLFSSELVSILVSLPISPESINSTLSLLLYKYAPIISTTISLHTNCPWFTPHIVKLKRSLRKTERKYRRIPSPENLLSFTNHRKFYKSQISKAKSSYYINKINSLSSIPRSTFALARKRIAPDPPLHIPYIPNIPKNKLCNEFSNFISNKILPTCSIITSLHQKYSIPCILISKPIDKYLSIFTTPSISNIYYLILKSNSSLHLILSIFILLKVWLVPYPLICILYSRLLYPIEF